jgi:DNA replication protein DnaC
MIPPLRCLRALSTPPPSLSLHGPEERYRRHATIITTNLDYEEWHNFLGNKALVDALLSRLRHQCHTVKIDGPSLREPQS